MRPRITALVVLALALSAKAASAQQSARPPLSAKDIDDIARLVMLEDHREFHVDDLTRLYASQHPEVRRRAALAIGRLADKRGIGLLRAAPLDADTSVAATAVFAIGQMHDSTMIAWFDSLLANTNPTVATEAAIALGKVTTSAARGSLARYLTDAEANPRTRSAIGEALLSIGRQTTRGDITPIVRWVAVPDEELRWRATWALFRNRDPNAMTALLNRMSDPSAYVRSWAVRGLTKAAADSAGVTARAEAVVIAATRDADRRVATEAVRTLGSYSDPAAIATLARALASKDAWISTSAAEGLGRIRSPETVRNLITATEQTKSCALRIVAMQALQTFSPNDALAAAMRIANDENPYCRSTAMQSLANAAPTAGLVVSTGRRETLAQTLERHRAEIRSELAARDVLTRVTALKSISAWADTSDLVVLRATLERARSEQATAVVNAATATIAAVERRASAVAGGGRGGAGGAGGGGGGGRGTRPPPPVGTRPLEDYKKIVERWVVPDYNGAPRPTAEWETPRGTITIELYPGDTPIAVDDFVRTMETNAIIGARFTRVVPDFVDQQETIRTGNTLRDEVNRRGLTRNNLAWATAGLDTGSPGYTLGHTPQPHNEGNFTSMGRVIRGMDASDRIELGDRVTAARMTRTR